MSPTSSLTAGSTWLLAAATFALTGCARSQPLQLDHPDLRAASPACMPEGLAACEAACKGGDAPGCLAAALAQLDKPDKGLPFAQRGCELGLGSACYAYAQSFAWDDPEALPWYARGCEAGHGGACTMAGSGALMQAKASDSDRSEADAYFERGCELGRGSACHTLGDLLYLGLLGPRDRDRAKTLHERACELGPERMCRALEDDGRLWTTLPRGLFFEREHAPIALGVTGGGSWTVTFGLCFPSSADPTAELLISSGEPDLDAAVLEQLDRWYFQLGPLYPEGQTLCFRQRLVLLTP